VRIADLEQEEIARSVPNDAVNHLTEDALSRVRKAFPAHNQEVGVVQFGGLQYPLVDIVSNDSPRFHFDVVPISIFPGHPKQRFVVVRKPHAFMNGKLPGHVNNRRGHNSPPARLGEWPRYVEQHLHRVGIVQRHDDCVNLSHFDPGE
jgi:hypothetical protein